MKSTFSHLKKFRRKALWVCKQFSWVIFTFLIMTKASFALSYYSSGLVDVFLGGHSRRVTPPTAITKISDAASAAHALSSALASASYYGNLSTGTVSASANAKNGVDNNVWYEASAESSVDIFDTLYFNIPAGVYQDGLSVSAKGHISGSWSDSLWGTSRFGFVASLGNEEFVVQDKNDFSDVHLNDINQNFTLTTTLLSPGTVLNADKEIIKGIRLSLGGPMSLVASTLANGNSGPKEKTFGSVNFSNTGFFSEINTPEGVTWTSASGTFLSQPSAVPVPSSIILFGSALGFLGFRLKNKIA